MAAWHLVRGRFAPAALHDNHPTRGSHLRAGELVGELAVVDGQKRSASVRAAADARLLWVPVARLREAGRGDSTPAQSVYQKLALGLASCA